MKLSFFYTWSINVQRNNRKAGKLKHPCHMNTEMGTKTCSTVITCLLLYHSHHQEADIYIRCHGHNSLTHVNQYHHSLFILPRHTFTQSEYQWTYQGIIIFTNCHKVWALVSHFKNWSIVHRSIFQWHNTSFFHTMT